MSHNTGALQQRVAALEQERAEFVLVKEQMEAEFNHKRAKLKELYISKDGEESVEPKQPSSCHPLCLYLPPPIAV